ncbi:MAG: efflux RND transporter permease subunit [Bacteroidales bacterium]|nr:efflux RND transporter permease subunit [Bacteroidales bacterium]
MSKRKTNHILAAIRSHNIIFFIVACLVLFGIFGLTQMNKDEFPQFTIRQGVVAAIYPGASAQEVEEQVTKPLERFLFTYEEVNKKLTYSTTENGAVYIYVELNVAVKHKDEVWSKIRHGLQLFKKTSLPAGVLEVVVVDDFGNTASMLLAVESPERTPRELEDYANRLCDNLRAIPEMGRIKITGQQKEEIAVLVDQERLASYGISQRSLLVELATQGLRTVSGSVDNEAGEALVFLDIPYQSEYELGEQIVYADPSGSVVRLRDIATIERRYAEPKSCIKFDGAPAVLISMEMNPGNNIVAFGKKVEKIIEQTRDEIPPDVDMHRITNQPKVVDKSVMSFLRDLLFSIIVVIAVMLLLFPLRTALVSSSSVPVCTAITMGLMYICGIEMNTVTLAALIVVLGLIVDDSVIVIDGYTDMIQGGHSNLYSAVTSTQQLFVPMSLATLAISGMFFPMTRIITGPLGDFVQLFPFTVAFALICSIFYAVWIIPYIATRYIRRQRPDMHYGRFAAAQNRFFERLQTIYENALSWCFRNPTFVVMFAFFAIGMGVLMFSRLHIQMLPKADRECFAVEIHLAEGCSLEQTTLVADSMEHILRRDPRVTSVTSFIGCSSPRFHATYAPQMAHKNYAQFIVNTKSEKDTRRVLKDYSERYAHLFPNCYVRFKQIDYQAVKNPVEIRLTGDDLDDLKQMADSLKCFMNTQPSMLWVHSDMDETSQNIRVELKSDEAMRLGVTQSMLSLYLSSALDGQALTSVWEGDYKVPVMLYTIRDQEGMSYQDMEDFLVPTSIPSVWVPLRQVATVVPAWSDAVINHRNGVRTVTVGADLREGYSQPEVMKILDKYIDKTLSQSMPQGVEVSAGGLTSINGQVIPQIALSFIAAVLVLFVFLLYHFAKIDVVMLTLSASLICIFGASLGLFIFQLDFSITAVLGVVSLIGIIVRNAIIMFEFAEMLRTEQHKSAKEAGFEAGKRRMRPIFLTSATTALGVMPMIVAHTALWMPMGVVICFGTIFSLPLVVTVLPVAYWQIFKRRDKK